MDSTLEIDGIWVGGRPSNPANSRSGSGTKKQPRVALVQRDAEGRRKTQYFETGGHRAIYHDGWVAASFHGVPWELAGSVGLGIASIGFRSIYPMPRAQFITPLMIVM